LSVTVSDLKNHRQNSLVSLYHAAVRSDLKAGRRSVRIEMRRHFHFVLWACVPRSPWEKDTGSAVEERRRDG